MYSNKVSNSTICISCSCYYCSHIKETCSSGCCLSSRSCSIYSIWYCTCTNWSIKSESWCFPHSHRETNLNNCCKSCCTCFSYNSNFSITSCCNCYTCCRSYTKRKWFTKSPLTSNKSFCLWWLYIINDFFSLSKLHFRKREVICSTYRRCVCKNYKYEIFTVAWNSPDTWWSLPSECCSKLNKVSYYCSVLRSDSWIRSDSRNICSPSWISTSRSRPSTREKRRRSIYCSCTCKL